METTLSFPSAAHRPRPWVGWLPLITFVFAVFLLRDREPAWGLMWLAAFVLFAGFKWWTWWRAVESGVAPEWTRSVAYILFWPGMGARQFLAHQPKRSVRTSGKPRERFVFPAWLDTISSEQLPAPRASQWAWAWAKTLLGAMLLWVVARTAGEGLLAGWIGMVGFIFLLHFGFFALLALFWQSRGIDAPPLMNCPIAAKSLQDFWGRRWNTGFHDIVVGLFFFPLARRYGATAGTVFTFLISGLIHELVITIPAGTDYGLPTLYFTLQGVGLIFERSSLGAESTRGWRGHAFALAVVIAPIFALFPPAFVLRVMVPFFQTIQALP